MDGFYQGASVVITATFTTPAGELVDPDTVTISLLYKVAKAVKREDFEMVRTGTGAYTYSWDSTGADAGAFSWTVKGISGANTSVAGGSDRLFGR